MIDHLGPADRRLEGIKLTWQELFSILEPGQSFALGSELVEWILHPNCILNSPYLSLSSSNSPHLSPSSIPALSMHSPYPYPTS